jgi:erythromycin esterase-like protein
MFEAEMVVFGFGFNEELFQAVELGQGLHDFSVAAAPPGSLDATFAATRIALFALDLRDVPKSGPVATWLNQPHKSRSIGAVYSVDSAAQYLMELNAPQSFEAMLFVEKTTAARQNPG